MSFKDYPWAAKAKKTISGYSDPRWKRLMELFQGARDTYNLNSPEKLAQTHQALRRIAR